MRKPPRLLTKQFVCYCAVMFLAFCNMAVFFQFNDYLKTLPTESDWAGFLIGVFSLTVLVVRPAISPFLHAENARLWIVLATCGIIVSLLLYNYGTTVPAMAGVRILHGVAYTLLAVAVLSGLTAVIPPDRSAQAFGLLSVLTLLPYAVVPPLVGPLGEMIGGFGRVLDLFALVMILVFPVAAFGLPKRGAESRTEEARIGWDDIVRNLKDVRVILLLVASLLVWSAFTTIFYYVKGFGEELRIANVGWFFTLSTLSEIAVRLVGGPYLDRLDKSKALIVSLLWLGVAYVVMGYMPGPGGFYAMGIVFGLGWGLAMPMLSSLMFDISEPKLRALNTNLSMEMFQGGYFLGPLIGGAILLRWGYTAMFAAGAGLVLAAAISLVPLMKKRA